MQISSFLENAQSIARKIIEHSGITCELRYAIACDETLTIGSDLDGCNAINEDQEAIIATVNAFRKIDEIKNLSVLRVDLVPDEIEQYYLIPLPMEQKVEIDPIKLRGEMSPSDRERLKRLLLMQDRDRGLLVEMIESGGSVMLIDMATQQLIFAIGETRFQTDAQVSSLYQKIIDSYSVASDRDCTPYWLPQDLNDFTRNVFQAPNQRLDNHIWYAKGTTVDGRPTDFFVEQRGDIRLVPFGPGDRPHRLVRMHETTPLTNGKGRRVGRIYLGRRNSQN